MSDQVVDILVVHAVILVVTLLGLRFTTLRQPGQMGLYLVLMPFGFLALGWDLGAWLPVSIGAVGVLLLLWALRKPARGVDRARGGTGDGAAEVFERS